MTLKLYLYKMRTTIMSILFLLLSNKMFCQVDFDEGLPKYLLKSIISSCQNMGDNTKTTTKLIYNDKKQLVKSILYYDTVQAVEVGFNYDNNGLFISKDYYYLNSQNQTMDYSRTKKFKYDSKNNLIHEGYDDYKGNDYLKNYVYDKSGRLILSTEGSNYPNLEFTYVYDSENRLKEKYKNGNLEMLCEYQYGHLSKEIRYNGFRTYKEDQTTIYRYDYDENGHLISKTENDKVIEKNIYVNNMLAEQWIYYLGIDPCYYSCCNQFVVRYSYY